MNLDLIKKKLQEVNEQAASRQDNSALRWSPSVGKQTIRIVPSVENPDNPFTELLFYNKLSRFPILALTNFGEQDPVQDFIEQLRATDDKDNWSLSGRIAARPRYFVPVIVRGEEDKGVRIWSISTSLYTAFLNFAADEDYGDFTDITNGFDFVVEKTAPKSEGQPADITIRPKRDNSVLSSNKEEVKKWLKEQPKVLDLFRKPTYDWLKKQLKAYIDGKPVVEEDAPAPAAEAPAEPVEAPKKEEKRPEPKKPAATLKEQKAKKFDDLFEDDGGAEPNKGDVKPDKLPWED